MKVFIRDFSNQKLNSTEFYVNEEDRFSQIKEKIASLKGLKSHWIRIFVRSKSVGDDITVKESGLIENGFIDIVVKKTQQEPILYKHDSKIA